MSHKYQFCIRFDGIDANSAASKAVLDCNRIFAENNYIDYTLTVVDNKNRIRYYIKLIKQLFLFIAHIKSGSLVGIQYPLLSINNVFKYFIKVARLKGVKFFCIIHDLESLRNGGLEEDPIVTEVTNLNAYDMVIAHNQDMVKWLEKQGVKSRILSLQAFDYLLKSPSAVAGTAPEPNTIVYAGNLGKSTFIYTVPVRGKWKFNVYGPNFMINKAAVNSQLRWCGEHSPEHIAEVLRGQFGLIWDGPSADHIDGPLGNYLRFNNPHKFSLYLAAGLPVIAPEQSAIASFIKSHNIGFVISSLNDLESVDILPEQYEEMKKGVQKLRSEVISGKFFNSVLHEIETYYG